MNVNRTQDFSISLTKLLGAAHVQSRVLPQPQLQGAEPRRRRRRLVPGRDQLRQRRGQPARHRRSASPTRRSASSRATSSSRKFVEGSFIYNHIDWYIQDNWKVNSKLTLDYGLRFVNQRPQYDQLPAGVQLLPGASGVAGGGAGALRRRLRRTTPTRAPATSIARRRNPVTGQLLGPNTSLAIGQLVPNTGDPINGIIVGGDGIAKGNYEWPTIGYAPRFGVAYDLTGDQRFILRGGAASSSTARTATRCSRRSAIRRSRRRRPSAIRSCRASARAGCRRRDRRR